MKLGRLYWQAINEDEWRFFYFTRYISTAWCQLDDHV